MLAAHLENPILTVAVRSIGDVSRPLKQLLPDYKRIEHDVEQAVFRQFGLPEKLPLEVKEADLRVLAAEQAQIMASTTSAWAEASGIYPATIRVEYMSPRKAKREFLKRYEELRAEPRFI